MGVAGSTFLMTFAVLVAVLATHIVLRLVEGQPLYLRGTLNVGLDILVVSGPLIFYSRRARGRLESMTRQLSVSADAALDASKAKSAFLANMSHELRTPLNAILGFSEIMKDQHLGPVSNARYLSYAADIHTSGRHLLGIINDVLDLAKIESGKMSLEDAGEFALVPSLSASLVMLSGLGDKHGVRVEERWDDEKIRLVAVERMVRQIVINLVGNAIKFTPQGGTVIVGGVAEDDGGYALTIRDNGIGMNDGEMANALTPFGQNRPKMAVRQEGTGLGLPLAKAMVELHGGNLVLESQPNRGTCVTLRFPAERVVQLREKEAA